MSPILVGFLTVLTVVEGVLEGNYYSCLDNL